MPDSPQSAHTSDLSRDRPLLPQDELEQLYKQAPCGYHSLDANGVFVRVNQTELNLLGYSRVELIGRMKFFDLLTPESQQIFQTSFPKFKQQGSIRDLEFQMIRKNGDRFPVSLSATAITDAAGNYVMSRSVMLDISDRTRLQTEHQQAALDLQEAHQRIVTPWETMTDAYASFDLDWHFTYANQAALMAISHLSGVAPNAILGKTHWELLPLLNDGIVEQRYRQAIAEQRPQHFEVNYPDTEHWFEVHAYPSAVGLGVYFRDITQKKQLETQFLRAQRLESLGTLASGIAHDLNNILTPMIGIVQLLPVKIPNLDPPTQRLLQILSDSSRRGADLVKQILSFTRGIEGQPTNTQIKHLIAEIQKVVQQTFPKNIDLVLDLPKELWLIAADATLLHQVLMNLCVNARDAMPTGGTLQITAENLAIDENYARMHLDAQVGDYVVVTIADTGMGIPPEVLDRIFEPFFTTKDVGQGTGLGLSTVIGIIKSHHGFVNVYSEVGKGTRFKVYLPASDTSATDTPIVEAAPRSGQGELILIVDDEMAIREVTQATLETYGYRTMIACDGVEAIALYAEHKSRISVVLLDLMMPALDAVTIIRTLCKLNPQVQIIAMSGLATNESVTRTIGAGVKAFLAKPFTAPELLELLDRVLGRA